MARLDAPAASLSFGELRVVELARALCAAPSLLMLDEPASGLDVGQARTSWACSATLADLGLAVLLIEHDMSVVMDVCEDITVLDFGHVIARGTPEEIQDEPGRPRRLPGKGALMLDVSRLSVAYGQARALYGVDLRVDDGEIVVALIGPNGAGKTTALQGHRRAAPPGGRGAPRRRAAAPAAVGASSDRASPSCPRAGRLSVDDRRGEPAPRRLLPRRNWRAVGRALRARSSSTSPAGERRRQPAGRLSGGEQQMLVIGRALLSEPKLVLIDELSLGLAPKLVQTLLEMIVRLNSERGTTFLLVEQAASAVLEISDRAYLLQKGRVVHEGDARELMSRSRRVA